MLKIIITILCTTLTLTAHSSPEQVDINKAFQAIEDHYNIKMGVYALDTNNNRVIAYHADDKFPFQSTCKVMIAAALLAKDDNGSLLNKTAVIAPENVISWSPVSGKYVNQPVSLQTLAEAATSYSDNTATNTLIDELGGLAAINQFMRSIGNPSFNLAHYEAALNSQPNQTDDTSTPKDMAVSLQNILFGNVLTSSKRTLLTRWMKDNTTGYTRIRAGVPLGWTVAEKTGSGHYGVTNDIGIAWSSDCKPVVLSIYTQGQKADTKPNDQMIQTVTQAIFAELAQHHVCYRATTLS